jgi:hypothetical protein
VPDLGIRLQLMIGPTVPVPAPYSVMEALRSLEVTNDDNPRDGFQMRFSLGKEPLTDYGLLRAGLLDPPNRVIIMVFFGALPQVLIDGIITRHEMVTSNEPGQSQLHVTGQDISLQLDFEEKSVAYRNMSDSVIVTQILSSYGLIPEVTTTSDVPAEVQRVTTQQGTDLDFITEKLAERNSFVFYVEPTDLPGVNRAYWGPERRGGVPQPTLTKDMGADTNLDEIRFGLDALAPTTPRVAVTEPNTRQSLPIPVPSSLFPSLAGQSVSPLRTTVPRDTANLSLSQGLLRALTAASSGADAVDASGVLDSVRYGRALRARQPVDVRGVGNRNSGTYYVKEVKHVIERGSYKQNFRLAREGLGATRPVVRVR